MKKAFSLFLLLLLTNILFSYNLTLVYEGEANYIATNWLIYINKIPLKDKLGNYQIRYIEQIKHKENPLCKIYHLYPSGHILVPSYKEFPPIKSFSVVSDFDSKSKGYEYSVLEELKAAFKFLQDYKPRESEEVEKAIGRNSDQWNKFVQMELERTHLEELDLLPKKSKKDGRNFILKDGFGVKVEATSAPPLLETRWGQYWPYWNWCPLLGGDRTVVGCVATAMAQIMKYYKWPKEGEGSYSYYWENGNTWLGAYFSDSYDWDYMPNTYWDYDTYREENAVAELCYEAGVSVNMYYGTDGSFASTSDVAYALEAYFKYSNVVKVVYRKNYGNVDAWFEVLKTQRDLSRPLEFAMYPLEGSGHAVVIDGYLITNGLKQVHINMGWYGSSDAYYTLDNILDYTDTYWQNAVIDIIPKWAQIQLYLYNDSLSFTGIKGQSNPYPQIFYIRNSGEGTLNYQISTNKNWISVSPESGSSTGEWDLIMVYTDISSLAKGTYSGTIEITSEDASNSPQEITVDLTVKSPQIKLNKTSLSFSGVEGESNPNPQHFKIRNSGAGSLNYQMSDNKNWIDVSPKSGSSTGEWDSIKVSIDISNLLEGSYSGFIEITDNNADNSPQKITVNLTVKPPPIYAPLNFSGTKVENRSLLQREYINVLTWKANPKNRHIEKYRIYLIKDEGQSLLIELDANTFEYLHRNVNKDEQYIYALVAVDYKNREGDHAFLSVQ